MSKIDPIYVKRSKESRVLYSIEERLIKLVGEAAKELCSMKGRDPEKADNYFDWAIPHVLGSLVDAFGSEKYGRFELHSSINVEED